MLVALSDAMDAGQRVLADDQRITNVDRHTLSPHPDATVRHQHALAKAMHAMENCRHIPDRFSGLNSFYQYIPVKQPGLLQANRHPACLKNRIFASHAVLSVI